MKKLTLFNYYRSSTSYRVRIALHLKNLAFEYQPIHLLNNGGEQNLPHYRNLNPIGGVPTLAINNIQYLSQSFAIIEYLDESYPQPFPLFSKDPFEKAKIKQICENINADIHPLQNLKVMQFLENKHSYTQDQKNEWCQKWITDGLNATEKLISETAETYSFGNRITAADLFIVPQLFSAERFKVDITQFKVLNKINKNCLNQTAFIQAHPYRQIDTPLDLRI